MLNLAAVKPLIAEFGRTSVLSEVRSHLESLREDSRRGALSESELGEARLAAALQARLTERTQYRLRRVFNLTGTVLHTNLGRAPLPREAVDHVAMAMCEPCNLEFDLARGERGDRDALVEELLCEITGAEAATVVNNNAAAVLLTIAALAARKQVLVSRGELVEIGGAFRMPDVMASAGAKMVEVGTTNRTHPRDYENAIGPATALIMKVHTSNYAIHGFTAMVDEAQLAEIAHRANLPFAVDLGSGSLVDLSAYGLPKEPLPQEAIGHGTDVVTFSGDKLLGGPQAGLIVGKRSFIQKIKKHPLKRALRVSKITLAALEATLALYRNSDRLAERLPALRMLIRPAAEIEALANRLLPKMAEALHGNYLVTVQGLSSQIGSGSLPIDLLPSAGLAIRPLIHEKRQGGALNRLADVFRRLPIPVIGRIGEGRFILDLRCLEDEAVFVAQLAQLKLRAGR